MLEASSNGNGTQVLASRERRHVFNEYTPPVPGRANRPFHKRKVSALSIVLSLFLFAGALVAYVGNIIAVNELVVEVERLKAVYSSTENMNNILTSEISRKSGMERITKIASEQMGMIFPRHPPVWFDLPSTAASREMGDRPRTQEQSAVNN